MKKLKLGEINHLSGGHLGGHEGPRNWEKVSLILNLFSFHQNVQKGVTVLIRSLIIVFVKKKEVIVYMCLSVHIKRMFSDNFRYYFI